MAEGFPIISRARLLEIKQEKKYRIEREKLAKARLAQAQWKDGYALLCVNSADLWKDITETLEKAANNGADTEEALQVTIGMRGVGFDEIVTHNYLGSNIFTNSAWLPFFQWKMSGGPNSLYDAAIMALDTFFMDYISNCVTDGTVYLSKPTNGSWRFCWAEDKPIAKEPMKKKAKKVSDDSKVVKGKVGFIQ